MTDPNMSEPTKTDVNGSGPEEGGADPWDDFTEELIRDAWQPALRMALDSHGAPGRCPRRACRLAGACRMTWKQRRPLDCGGGVTDEALKTAAVAALFGSLMARRLMEDGVIPPRRARAAGGAARDDAVPTSP